MSQTTKSGANDQGKVVTIHPARSNADTDMKTLQTIPQSTELAKAQPVAPVPASPRDVQAPQRGRKAPPLPKRRKRRSFGLFLSMFFFITLPTAIAAVYYFGYAADQYVTTAQYTIRTQSMGRLNLDNIGVPGAINPMSPAFGDSLMVQNYIKSGQLLKDIAPKVDLYTVYSHPAADWWTKLDPSVSDEGLLDYWHGVSSVHYDLLTGITTFTVRAFSPEDAQKVGQSVLEASEALVNELSERARGDVVKLAQAEADKQRERMDRSIAAIEAFQTEEQQMDSGLENAKQLELRGKLEGEIALRQAELAALRAQLSENAPSVKLLKGAITSMKAELESMKSNAFTGGDGRKSAPERTGTLTVLKIEQEISAKLYTQSLATLEAAKQESQMQSRYLVTFVKPTLPDASLYPARLYSIGIVFAVACMVWLFATLIGAVIREHV